MRKTHLIVLAIAATLFFLSEGSMAFFANKSLNAQQFEQLIHSLTSADAHARKVNRVTLKDMAIPLAHIEDVNFATCEWKNINASEIGLKNVSFEDCVLSNVNFSGAKLDKISFINSILDNVIMNGVTATTIDFSNSKIIGGNSNTMNSYRKMNAKQIIFTNSNLSGLNFFESKAAFEFKDSTLYDISGVGLLPDSALLFDNTHASLIDFDQSDLLSLKIVNSTIDKQSSAGGGSIKHIYVNNSKLKFAISDNSNVDSITYDNSGDVVVGGGKNVKVTRILNCPKGTNTVFVGSNNFELIEIDNCKDLSSILFTDSIGAKVVIRNSEAYEMDFRDSVIANLVFQNVTVHGSLEYSDTKIANYEASGVSFDKGIKIYNDGSNMEIKPNNVQ